MSSFEVVCKLKADYDCVILASSFDSPINDLDAIVKELSENHLSKGKILFDLLLSVGNSSERFIEAQFLENKFIMNSFRCVSIPKESEIRKIITRYVSSKPCVLEYSILNNMQKRIIRKGIAI